VKRLILTSLFLIGFASLGLSEDMPYTLYSKDGNINKLSLINTMQDIYVRLGLTVNTYGTQTITGTKTFSSTITGDISGNAGTLDGYNYTAFVDTFSAQSISGTKTFSRILGGGNKILQVVSFSTTTVSSTNSGSWQTTALTATITPLYSTSKILVLAKGNMYNSNASYIGFATLMRGSTNLALGNFGLNFQTLLSDIGATLIAHDSPASTSAIVYSVKIATSNTGTTVTWNNGVQGTATIILMEIGE